MTVLMMGLFIVPVDPTRPHHRIGLTTNAEPGFTSNDVSAGIRLARTGSEMKLKISTRSLKFLAVRASSEPNVPPNNIGAALSTPVSCGLPSPDALPTQTPTTYLEFVQIAQASRLPKLVPVFQANSNDES